MAAASTALPPRAAVACCAACSAARKSKRTSAGGVGASHCALPSSRSSSASSSASNASEIELAAPNTAAGSALAVERRVIAARPGESAFLLALDRFLQDLDEVAVRRLAAEEAGR